LTCTDGAGFTDTTSNTFTVVDAVEDPVTTPEDTPVDIDVAGNDLPLIGIPPNPPALDPASVVVWDDPDTLEVDESQPVFGSLANNGDGTFTYTPDPDFPLIEAEGTDGFSYQICGADNPGACDTAAVSITVTQVNDAPVAVDDGGPAFTVAEDSGLFTTPSVVANDTDVEDGSPDASTTTVVSGLSPAEAGTLVNNGDGTFDFTSAPNWSGEATFTYAVDDSAGLTSNVATVTITVMPVVDVTLNWVGTTVTQVGGTVPLRVTAVGAAVEPAGTVVVGGTVTFEVFEGDPASGPAVASYTDDLVELYPAADSRPASGTDLGTAFYMHTYTLAGGAPNGANHFTVVATLSGTNTNGDPVGGSVTQVVTVFKNVQHTIRSPGAATWSWPTPTVNCRPTRGARRTTGSTPTRASWASDSRVTSTSSSSTSTASSPTTS
jgi:hypothetical protein